MPGLAAAGHTVVAVDLRGTGDSAKPETGYAKEAYLAPGWTMSSPGGGLTDADRAQFLAHYAAPGGMRGGFQHYATLLADGRTNRARLPAPEGRLTMPVLVLSGDQSAPQAGLLDGVRQVASDVSADIVPGAGHAIAADNPDWVITRLTRFFAAARVSST